MQIGVIGKDGMYHRESCSIHRTDKRCKCDCDLGHGQDNTK